MISARQPRALVTGVVMMLLLTGVALALASISLRRNLTGACDANEWPYLSSCPKVTSVAVQVNELRMRAARNPGDASTYLALALLATQPGGAAPLDENSLLSVVSLLAGQDPVSLRLQATREVQRKQWRLAVPLLARLVMDYQDEAALRTLASLVRIPDAQRAMIDVIRTDSRWVQPLLSRLPSMRVPVVQALPLVESALVQGLIKPEKGLEIVNQLKASGNWLEAQALWLRLLARPVPFLYNGDFEEGFFKGGFDWEVADAPANRTGVQIRQPVTAGAKGRALELGFNGRPLALPVMGQYLVLFPGTYTFAGRFMAQRLRAGAGLIWVFTCTGNGVELARTSPIKDTKGQWQDLSLPLIVPENCGAVLLKLQTELRSDALSGLQGEAYFDEFRLSAN